MQIKSILIWFALLVTLVLSWQSLHQTQDTEIVVKQVSTQPSILMQPELGAQTLHLSARQAIVSEGNLFSTPYVAPVRDEEEIEVIEKPRLTVAPRLPFTYIGRWKDQAQQVVMLEANGEVISAKQGDILLHQYEVTRINETPQGLSVEFLYQPLQQIQFLQVGISNDEQSHP